MSFRRLFVFVEGDDDERLFGAILVPLLQDRYDHVDLVPFSERSAQWLDAYLRSIQAMQADYLVVCDLDRRPCVSAAKEALRARFPVLDLTRVQIVCTEIEGWYSAGLGAGHPDLGSLAIAKVPDTSKITKEDFLRAMEARSSRAATMRSILDRFDLALAARRNASLRYFLRKHAGLDV